MMSPVPSGVAPFNVKAAVEYGLFVKAAYTMYGNEPQNPMPKPSADFPSGYRLSSWITMQDFVFDSTPPQFYGFIAQNTENPNRFVLALRGTTSATEWWDDLNAVVLAPFKVTGFGSVGNGFAKIYDTLHMIENPPSAAATRALDQAGGFSAQVKEVVSRHALIANAAQGGATIEVVGHSLGSALATLYVAENAKKGGVNNPALCTFASPLVGDAEFKAAFDALAITSWRVTIAADVVTMLPPPAAGFAHVDTLTELHMPWNSRWYWPPCTHVLMTYLHELDPAQPSSPACAMTFGAQRAVVGAVTPPVNDAASASRTSSAASGLVVTAPQGPASPSVTITFHP